MDPRNDPAPPCRLSGPPLPFSASSTSSSSSVPSFTQSSFSIAAGLEPLLPLVSPSSSDLVLHPNNLVFSSSSPPRPPPSSSSPPSLNFEGFAACAISSAQPKIASYRALSSPAEPKIASSFAELSGSSSPSPASPRARGMCPPASQAYSLGLAGDPSAAASSCSQPPFGATVVTAAGEDAFRVPRPLEALHAVSNPPFLSKTYELVDDASLDAVLSWAPSGESFVVWDPVEFSRTVLPRHFKHNNFSSFVRQLNTYGFHKIDTGRWEFANEGFLRGQKHLLRNIHRRRSSQIQLGGYLGGSIELRRSGLEGELEKLGKDKNLLVEEVVKLQKEHLTMIHQMDTMKQRMQLAEQRQKQMVSFLAKVLQNPAFLDHLRRQKEQREIATTRVKRKFLRQLKAHQGKLGSPCDGKIVKYKQTQDSAISSSMNQVTETNVPSQLPDSLFQEMEDKLGLDMTRQEFFQTLSETGERTPAFMDNNNASFKGKGIVSSPMDTITADADYFVSFPEYISQEKIFLDAISQENDGITLPEETWNMSFISGDSLLNPGKDVWDNLFDEDTQEQGTAGSSTTWNMKSRKGDLEIDKLVGDKYFFLSQEDHAGLVKQDSLENMDP